MTARSFISSHRNCRRFLAATHHAAILDNYSHDLQVLHFTLERGGSTALDVAQGQSAGGFLTITSSTRFGALYISSRGI